ncbi:MAG: protein kinase [Gemmatimonadetes bacterium]|nr:protein kinase [Gemmatimonadota bacterium]
MTDIREQLQSTLGGGHTLERELGGGGMSRVFVATENALGRRVVVKVLPPELLAGVNVDRFNREIKLAAQLQHPHIVPVITAGETDGLPYYTMPFVEGESLRSRIAEGPLPIDDAVSILRDVAKALAFAHGRGVVHRDIKPDNVLLAEGSAVVTDFGIAKALSAAKSATPTGDSLTQVGMSIGTPLYMAPEQAAGDPDTDHRADIYSWGIMAYEMLTGQPPFHGLPSAKLLMAHLSQAPTPITELRSDIPPSLADLVMRCLEKDPADRPQTASEVARALEHVATSGSMASMSPLLLGGKGMVWRALALYALAFIAVAVLAKAAIVGIGLPDWVLPGAIGVMALGLPAILFTAYVHRSVMRSVSVSQELTPNGTHAAPRGTMSTMAVKASPHVSWRRTLFGGVYALIAFVVVVGGWMVMRAMGIGPAGSLMASGKLGDQARVLIADFRGDSMLARAAAEGVRADLQQSKVISLVTPAMVSAALGRMQKPVDTKLTPDVSRDLAAREGIRAIVDGEVTQAGSGFLVTLRLLSADSGTTLASYQKGANSPSDLIETIGALTRQLRGKIGESLKDVQGGQRLEEVTTASLPALQRYSEGIELLSRKGDFTNGIRKLEQAIHLDTAFAMAYRRLAVELSNRGGYQDRVDVLLQKAYDHQDRLSEVEKQMAIAAYWNNRSPKFRDTQKALAAYEAALAANPNYGSALNNAALLNNQLGHAARAESLYRKAISLNPSQTATYYGNLMSVQLIGGRVAAAESTYQQMAKNFPTLAGLAMQRVPLLDARQQPESAKAVLRANMQVAASNVTLRESLAGTLSAFELREGHVRESQRLVGDVVKAQVERGVQGAGVGVATNRAYTTLWVYGDSARARVILDSLTGTSDFQSIPESEKPWSFLAQMNVLLGRRQIAKRAVDEALKQLGQGNDTLVKNDRTDLEATRDLADGKVVQAITKARSTGLSGCKNCDEAIFGYLFDVANMPDSALVAYERYLAVPYRGVGNESQFLAGTYKRLGELYEAKGNVTKALENYERFVDLWKTADPELQPRVAEVKARIARLSRGRG